MPAVSCNASARLSIRPQTLLQLEMMTEGKRIVFVIIEMRSQTAAALR